MLKNLHSKHYVIGQTESHNFQFENKIIYLKDLQCNCINLSASFILFLLSLPDAYFIFLSDMPTHYVESKNKNVHQLLNALGYTYESRTEVTICYIHIYTLWLMIESVTSESGKLSKAALQIEISGDRMS